MRCAWRERNRESAGAPSVDDATLACLATLNLVRTVLYVLGFVAFVLAAIAD